MIPAPRTRATLFLLALFLLAGCAAGQPYPAMPSGQSDFTAYAQETTSWLRQNRTFQTPDKETELALAAPREWRPRGTPRAGVLLLHGLGGSPYFFTDLGPALAARGFLVRAPLLPGHGTNPVHLTSLPDTAWRDAVREQTAFMARDVERVFVGGFSLGGALALSEALEDKHVAGLLLFSPALAHSHPYAWLVPWMAPFRTWPRPPSPDRPQMDQLRYRNIPARPLALLYQDVMNLHRDLEAKGFNRPALLAVAERDSLLDSRAVAALFSQYFTHSASRLIWYGPNPPQGNPRVIALPDVLPDERISGFSHMCLPFSPDNPRYGRQGTERICENGQSPEDYAACKTGAEIWYSEWGRREPGKIHARLTFNPYFSRQLEEALKVLEAGM